MGTVSDVRAVIYVCLIDAGWSVGRFGFYGW